MNETLLSQSWENKNQSLNNIIKESLVDTKLTPQEAATILISYEREKDNIQTWTYTALHDLKGILNSNHDIRSLEYIPQVISSLRTMVLQKTKNILSGKEQAEHLQQYLQSLSPQQIQDLAIRSVKWKDKHDILTQNLGAIQMNEWDIRGIIDGFSEKLRNNNPTENPERQKKIKELYDKLTWDLRSRGMSVSDFFMKLYIHESRGDRKKRTVNVFSSSGSWSLGITQSTRFAYNNTHIGTQYNPFVPEQAIPWSIEYFLLACYANSGGTGMMKVARALDIYNKWGKGTKKVPNADLLSPHTTKKDERGNPYNYAYQVLDT